MTIGVLWEYPVEVIFISSMSSPSQLAFSFRVMPLSGLETTGWKGTTVTAGVPQIYSCWSWVNGVPHVGWVFQCRFCQCQEGHNCYRLHNWFVFFNDFNDGKYPRSKILWKKTCANFLGSIFLDRVIFCGEMLGIPKGVAFSRGFFWWFSGATAQRYQSHWNQAERAIELERFHIHCDVCPRRKTQHPHVCLWFWGCFPLFFAAFNRLGTSKTIARSCEPMLLKRRGVFKPNFLGTYGTFQKDWIMAKRPTGFIKAGPQFGLRFWIHSICALMERRCPSYRSL